MVNTVNNNPRNYVKALALGVMAGRVEHKNNKFRYYLIEGEHSAWLSIPDIAELAGVNARSLTTLIKRWHAWRYVEAHSFNEYQTNTGRPHTFYKITQTGLSYINNMPRWFPRAREAFNKLDADIEHKFYTPRVRPKFLYFPTRRGSNIKLYWPFAEFNDASLNGRITIHDTECSNLDVALDMAEYMFGLEVSGRCRQGINWLLKM